MIRGTTPTHTFNLPISPVELKNVRVIYKQGNDIVLVKELCHCNVDGNSISFKLSQEETLKFDCHKVVKIQLRALTIKDEAPITKVFVVKVDECLEDEVIK